VSYEYIMTLKKYMMTIYTVVMLLFTVALNTVQKQWTFQIYIQGVTPTVWFEYQTQNKTKHVKVNVFCW